MCETTHGIYHKMSPKHLDRHVTEFAGRHNVRDADTIDPMGRVFTGMVGKRLRYQDLMRTMASTVERGRER